MLAHLEPKIHELRLLAAFRLIRPGMQGKFTIHCLPRLINCSTVG